MTIDPPGAPTPAGPTTAVPPEPPRTAPPGDDAPPTPPPRTLTLSDDDVAATAATSAYRQERLAAISFGLAIAACVTFTIVPGIAALVLTRRITRRAVEPGLGERTAKLVHWARRLAVVGIYLGSMASLALVVAVSWTGLGRLRATFFNGHFLADSFPDVRHGFFLNIQLFMVTEVLVLAWALVVALLRSAPGRALAPLRWLAVGYIDLFRGLPAIVTIYLIGFGLPIAGIPLARNLSLFQLGVLALTLIYGAYVAEVYRAGIETVHWSQTAAARSLGLSHGQTMRFVVVPQAIRSVIPPLLNDFISLQKDTALVSVIGLLEGFNRSRIYAGNHFNLSAVTGLGLCFVVITIPLARFTDYLLARDQRRTRARG